MPLHMSLSCVYEFWTTPKPRRKVFSMFSYGRSLYQEVREGVNMEVNEGCLQFSHVCPLLQLTRSHEGRLRRCSHTLIDNRAVLGGHG
ncbi:hypothetical protein ACET3X_001824 [Alternaria dauci]|uniref:Uncharacterized protein n=1 Tax=Alternaria dauci TaxID=48095 RepID=A0ABR3UYR9_9PLEO